MNFLIYFLLKYSWFLKNVYFIEVGFPGGLDGKESAYSVGDLG